VFNLCLGLLLLHPTLCLGTVTTASVQGVAGKSGLIKVMDYLHAVDNQIGAFRSDGTNFVAFAQADCVCRQSVRHLSTTSVRLGHISHATLWNVLSAAVYSLSTDEVVLLIKGLPNTGFLSHTHRCRSHSPDAEWLLISG
jgi:hypothetical protein